MGILNGKQETGRAAVRRTAWQLRRTFLLVGGFSMFANLLMLAAPLYMLQVYDRVLVSQSYETLFYLTVIALAAFATYAAIDYVRNRLLAKTAGWTDRFLRDTALDAQINSHKSGNKAQPNLLSAITTLRSTLSGSGVSPLMDMPWTPIFIVALFLLHPTLGWVVTAGALTLFALALFNDAVSSPPISRGEERVSKCNQLTASALQNADSVNAMGLAEGLRERLRQLNDDAMKTLDRASVRSGFISALSRFVRYGLQIAILGVGALLALQGHISAGAIVAASILAGRALAPVDRVISSWRAIIAARESFATVKDALCNSEQVTEHTSLPRPVGKVSVEHLAVTPQENANPILSDVTFELEAGDSLGLSGPIGSGKTTLARILAGCRVPSSGHARLDGADLATWHAADRGKHIGYLPQVVGLLTGTIRDNIARFGDAGDEAVIEAAQMAGAHEMILSLPQGYDTEVGPAGVELSGGQRQQIALARALFGDPAFVVLDEPNANLDQEGREKLLTTLRVLNERRVTTIVVSHRSELLTAMDKLLVLKDGKLFAFDAASTVLQNLSNQYKTGAAA